ADRRRRGARRRGVAGCRPGGGADPDPEAHPELASDPPGETQPGPEAPPTQPAARPDSRGNCECEESSRIRDPGTSLIVATIPTVQHAIESDSGKSRDTSQPREAPGQFSGLKRLGR